MESKFHGCLDSCHCEPVRAKQSYPQQERLLRRSFPSLLAMTLNFIFILVTVFLIYFPSLRAEFMLDAHHVVENNSAIKQPKLFKTIWQRGFFESYKDSFHFPLNYYRPVTTWSFALNYPFALNSPLGYRCVNVFIHALNAFLVFLLIYLLFRHQRLAFYSMVLFALHPVHEWVVNYIVGRSDLLQMLFSLGSLILFIRFVQIKKSYLYVLSIVSFMLGLLSREATILFPLYVFIVSCVLSRGCRRAIHDTIPFLCISVGYFLLRESISPVVGEGIQSFSWAQIWQWKILTGQYYLRFFFPWSVSSNYFYIFDNLYLLGSVWLLLVAGMVRYFSSHDYKFHQRPQILGLLWLMAGAVSLYPTTHMFVRLGPYLSEHFLYFPSIGFVILMAAFLLTFQKNTSRWIFGWLVLMMVSMTFENNTHWTTEKDLLKRVYAKEEGRKTVAYEQLLMRYTDDPRIVKDYMIGLDDSYVLSLWNNRLGHIYAEKKDYQQAQKYLLEAIELNPKNWEAHNALAVVYLNQGDLQEGKDLLLRVIRLDPENRDAYRLLGDVAYNHSRYPEAVWNFQQALFYDPDDVTLLGYLAMAYLFDGQTEGYQQIVDEIFQKRHDTKEVILFFVNELSRHGLHQQAIELMEQNKQMLFKNK